ncbi:hypothetical protein [Nocardia canadensis]|uniref:hypothetical protein n=1 Tax=Nocardia canadensis TaxID=3065238 RepID=UPI00292E3087|nr:hypothetical protein [Nocardia canadensis]
MDEVSLAEGAVTPHGRRDVSLVGGVNGGRRPMMFAGAVTTGIGPRMFETGLVAVEGVHVGGTSGSCGYSHRAGPR